MNNDFSICITKNLEWMCLLFRSRRSRIRKPKTNRGGETYLNTLDFNLEIIKTIGLQNIKFYALKVCFLGYREFKHWALGHCIS